MKHSCECLIYYILLWIYPQQSAFHFPESYWVSIVWFPVTCLAIMLNISKENLCKIFYVDSLGTYRLFEKKMCDLINATHFNHGSERDLCSCEVTLSSYKNSEAPIGFKPMTSTIPVWCSTDWAMKPRRKQARGEFNLCPLYMKRMTWMVHDKDHTSELRIKNRHERDLCSCEVITNKAQNH